MFEHLRESWRTLVDGSLSPDKRREVVTYMKATLVEARVSLSAMRDGVTDVRARLEHERVQLATVRRRKQLAVNIRDAETVTVAERFERLHDEHCGVLTKKLEAQEAELALAEREVAEMAAELKLAIAGVMPGSPSSAAAANAVSDAHSSAHAAEIDAELRLAALKRRLGK
jgi:hypothetical protein